MFRSPAGGSDQVPQDSGGPAVSAGEMLKLHRHIPAADHAQVRRVPLDEAEVRQIVAAPLQELSGPR